MARKHAASVPSKAREGYGQSYQCVSRSILVRSRRKILREKDNGCFSDHVRWREFLVQLELGGGEAATPVAACARHFRCKICSNRGSCKWPPPSLAHHPDLKNSSGLRRLAIRLLNNKSKPLQIVWRQFIKKGPGRVRIAGGKVFRQIEGSLGPPLPQGRFAPLFATARISLSKARAASGSREERS